MVRLEIKALSVNDAYRGRRFATKELTQYKSDLGWLLPRGMHIPSGPLSVRYVFGVNSKASDLDNLVKALQDVIAAEYGFNDNRIYHIDVTKVDVPKGKEFVEFEISTYRSGAVSDGSV